MYKHINTQTNKYKKKSNAQTHEYTNTPTHAPKCTNTHRYSFIRDGLSRIYDLYPHIKCHTPNNTLAKVASGSSFTHIQIHTHTHIHAYTHTHIHTYTHTRIHTYTHTHIHTYTHKHTYTHTHMHTYTHTRILAYTHTHIHAHTLTRIHTYTHTYIQTCTNEQTNK